MKFKEWFYSAPHCAKYTNDHPVYLAAQEAWEAAHEACAQIAFNAKTYLEAAEAIRARGQE